ncbi:MAG: DNA repair protein RecN [Ruminococcaceae bacterium]|nr:DNA repair protein RecN [Oscillospiraceae bacterium]
MLRSLHIENVAVIRRADVDFRRGLSVLTGETGAGKSMIIDSINLLMGNRVSREMIRSGEERATVSAVFEELSERTLAALEELGFFCEDGALILQRSVSRDGRSQTKLNGQTIPVAMQKQITPLLISVHGQMDSHKLLCKGTHLELLDAYARPNELLAAYGEAYQAYRETKARSETFSRDEAEKLRLQEMYRFQLADIDSHKLKAGEEEALCRERDRLLNLERINRQAELAYRYLCGGEKGDAVALIRRAQSAIRSLEGIVEGANELAERLAEAESEVVDVAERVLSFTDDNREDPTARIDRIEGRLEKISRLKRKYGNSIDEILAFRKKIASELDELELSDERRAELELQCAEYRRRAEEIAATLREARMQASERVVAAVTEALGFLDMPKVRFEVRFTPCELNETGADDVEFLIATNPGEPVQPLAKIASGGELSRMMLALRSVLDDRDGATTVIFDEIDTGVSGKTSRKIGLKLHETAERAQVLCVTHSAQIASLADVHYLITKGEKAGRAETEVRELTFEERVEEVARILGGIEVTAAQRDAAREMISEYRK